MRIERSSRGPMRALSLCLSVVLMAGVFGTVATAQPGSRQPASPVQVSAIDWGRCADTFLRHQHARCGMLEVPLDYDDPSGPKIELALSRVRHSVPEDRYQGVMLVNPGGPGGSGLSYSALANFIPEQAGGPYDWIGFDPRGVGSSRPSLSCLPNYFHPDRPPYAPNTEEIEARWLDRAARYADACAANAPELLQHMSTIDAARDMEAIRRALGVDQINYLGASYGTYLGQVYATLFPGSMRRAVFDSTVDPSLDLFRLTLEQTAGFDRNVRIWFAWLATHHDVYHLGKTEVAVTRTYVEAQRDLKRHPAGGVVGPAEWSDAFLSAAYCRCVWERLGDAFSRWVHGGAAGKLTRAYLIADTPGDDNGYAVRMAVWCSDMPWPTEWDTWRTAAQAVSEQAPLFAWANARDTAPCMTWGAPAGVPVTVQGDATRLLMISETLDAATPYEWSLSVRSEFPNAVLIAEPGGTTHAGAFTGDAPACVFDRIYAFLATGELPTRQPGNTADLECEPVPQPVPNG